MLDTRTVRSCKSLLLGLAGAGILIASLVLTPSVALAEEKQAEPSPMPCADLAKLHLPDTLSITSELVTGGTFDPPGPTAPLTDLPSFCRVSLVVAPQISIEVWLPTATWNARFQAVGGGGYAGEISWRELGRALSDGYATASTDTGHASSDPVPALDGSFGLDPDGTLNWELIVDFASRSLFEMTVKAKAVIRAFYGKKAKYSYWTGCSTGGRQGLMQVQRTPEAYDGVLAGAPAINLDRFQPSHLYPQIAMKEEVGQPIEACKFNLANNAALAACDGLDGVVDGVLEDPRQCHFDPIALQCPTGVAPSCNCLTSGEVSAIHKILDGAHSTAGERLWYGLARTASFLGLAGPNPFPIALWHLRWVKQDLAFDWHTLDYAGFDEFFEESQLLFNDVIGTDDPDLSQFRRSRGKLLMWHGWTDQLIFPRGTIDYYDRIVDRMGGLKRVQRFARLFMAPGVNHCIGGAGPNAFGQTNSGTPPPPALVQDAAHDMVRALVRWVEQGIAPDKIIATKYVNNDPAQGVVRTRPLCAYPKVAVYDGSGSPDEATSFVCRE